MKNLLLLIVPLILSGCAEPTVDTWQGYLEAEFVRVASPLGGTLEELEVERGDTVTGGQRLFVLERAAEQAVLREATDQLAQAASRLEDLRKGLRPTELAALEARVAQAESAAVLAEQEFARATALLREQTVAQSEFDQAQTARDQARQGLEAARAELATARLGGREDVVRAAEAEVAAREASLTQARWGYDQKQRTAPVPGLVQDTYYRPGEWVAPGNPVLALFDPARLRVRFFVPESRIGTLRIGESLAVTLDGRPDALPARVSYIAPEPEFTPPVIYSQENRSKLVFLVEATFTQVDPALLHPGQPVDVRRATNPAPAP